MLKFFQKLKARKGFTLVELIVVIAIIGVLAAILIPTMLGYVTKSRVTSANSTAASIKNNIDTFLTNADTAGYGMKLGKGVNQIFTISVTGSGSSPTWSINANNIAQNDFKSTATMSWKNGAPAQKTKDDPKVGVTNAIELLEIELANLFPEMKNASIYVVLNGGKCVAVAYTADQSSALTPNTNMPSLIGGGANPCGFNSTYQWDTKTAGVASDGIIVGTAPAIPIN